MNPTHNIVLPQRLPQDLRKELSNLSSDNDFFDFFEKEPGKLMTYLNACKKPFELANSPTTILLSQLETCLGKLTEAQQIVCRHLINKKRFDSYLPANCSLVDGKTIYKVNRLRLRLQSQALNTLFNHADFTITKPENFDSETFAILADYLKTGSLPALSDEKQISALMQQAACWEHFALLELIAEKCLFNPTNCFDIYLTAKELGAKKIQKAALTYLSHHAKEIQYKRVKKAYYLACENSLDDLKFASQKWFLDFASGFDIPGRSFEHHLYPDQRNKIKAFFCDFSFSKEHLAKLSASQLDFLLYLIPEKVDCLNLSHYSDQEIEKLVLRLPNHLKELHLSGVALSGNTITTIVKNCQQLEELNLASSVKWNQEDPTSPCKEDWSALQHLKNLKVLNLFDCPSAHEYLPSIIQQSPELVSLNIGLKFFRNTWWTELTRGGPNDNKYMDLIKQHCPKLKHLSVNCVTLNGLRALNGINLSSFSLSDSRDDLFDSLILAIGIVFPHLTQLKLLNVSSLHPLAVQGLAEGLPHLEDLEIQTSQKNEKDAIFHFAKNCANLHTIKHNHPLDEETCRVLAENCHHLKRLRCPISTLGLEALLKNPNIDLEELGGCQIYQQEILENVANQWQKLQKLDNCRFHLPSEKLREAFFKLKHLRKLTLIINNEHTENFLKNVGKLCPKMTSLNIILTKQLRYNELHPLLRYIGKLSSFKNLRKLSLDLNEFSGEALKKLIGGNTKLKKLELKLGNCSNSNFLSEIAQILPRSLKRLHVATELGEESLPKFLPSIEKNSLLKFHSPLEKGLFPKTSPSSEEASSSKLPSSAEEASCSKLLSSAEEASCSKLPSSEEGSLPKFLPSSNLPNLRNLFFSYTCDSQPEALKLIQQFPRLRKSYLIYHLPFKQNMCRTSETYRTVYEKWYDRNQKKIIGS